MTAAVTTTTPGFFPARAQDHAEARTGGPEPEYLGDMLLLERDLTPQEAQLLSGCLRAAGIAAEAGDTGIVQAHSLLAIAVGGACLRVPQTQLQEAREVLAAFRRGELALEDDFDVGSPPTG
jgi:hypothetical protein